MHVTGTYLSVDCEVVDISPTHRQVDLAIQGLSEAADIQVKKKYRAPKNPTLMRKEDIHSQLTAAFREALRGQVDLSNVDMRKPYYVVSTSESIFFLVHAIDKALAAHYMALRPEDRQRQGETPPQVPAVQKMPAVA